MHLIRLVFFPYRSSIHAVSYWFRELRCVAVMRVRYYNKSGVWTPESHILFQTQFSAVGFLHYTTTSAGRDHNYSPLLYKHVYSMNEFDWKVGYLLQDLPLRWEASPGELYVSNEWLEIDFWVIFYYDSSPLRCLTEFSDLFVVDALSYDVFFTSTQWCVRSFYNFSWYALRHCDQRALYSQTLRLVLIVWICDATPCAHRLELSCFLLLIPSSVLDSKHCAPRALSRQLPGCWWSTVYVKDLW